MRLPCAVLAVLLACGGGTPDARVDATGSAGSDSGDLGHELDDFIAAQMSASKIPGLGAAIVKGPDVAWSHGYGLANVAASTPVTPDTIFMLASVSKTFVAVAAMQAVEAGKLDLDADVNTYLPFTVRNPAFSTVPITTRQLLTHTSSIEDTGALLDVVVDGDSPIALGDWLKSYLVPNGAHYSTAVYANARPGTRFSYSNEAVALAGYVIERATGTPFDAFTKASIFTPLGMTETSWHLAGLDVSHIATPYEAGAPVAQYGYPDYPNGELRTSAPQLGRFLSTIVHDGSFGGTRVVSAASVTEILRLQVSAIEPSQGLIFYYFDRAAGHLVGHDGADAGVHTIMAFRPADGVGVIVLTNGYATETGMLAIFDRLFDAAAAL